MMSWVEKNRKINKRGEEGTIIRDLRVSNIDNHKMLSMADCLICAIPSVLT